MGFIRRRRELLALLAALGVFAAIMIGSVKDDTLTTDEALYIATGYRYLATGNLRLGFEHPPLMRNLALSPLLALNLKPVEEFINPSNRDLTEEVWRFGDRFVYQQPISPEAILLSARVPMIFFCLAFALFLYLVVRRQYGWQAGVLSLGLFMLSPMILAHGRLMTLDVPSAFGIFLCVVFFCRFLEREDRKSVAMAGVTLGVAFLIKFSLITLVPFLSIAAAAYVYFFRRERWKSYAFKTVGVFAVAWLIVGIVYAFHLFNYPKEQHVADIQFILDKTRPHVAPMLRWIAGLAELSFFRPWAHYLFGAAWQLTRGSAYGYFMGEGSFSTWRSFYPVGYLLKLPLAFHVLTLIAVFQALRELSGKKLGEIKHLISSNLFVAAGAAWVAYYVLILVFVNAGNTGSRYLIPALPFVFILVSLGVLRWICSPAGYQRARVGMLLVLLIWQAGSVFRSYPSFLSYFNGLVGPEKGSYYLVDTDVEWGQDTKRLGAWMKEHRITKLRLGDSYVYTTHLGSQGKGWVFSHAYQHYLGKAVERLEPGVPSSGWIAVPARALRWGQAKAAAKSGWSSDSFRWLQNYKPMVIIGNSIYVYYIE